MATHWSVFHHYSLLFSAQSLLVIQLYWIFQFSYLIVQLYDFCLVLLKYFLSFLLKSSLYSCIALLTSVSIFTTVNLTLFWIIHLISILLRLISGTSLVAQLLRIRLSMQGTQVQALVREDPTCRGATKPMRHNYWACALEPASHNY